MSTRTDKDKRPSARIIAAASAGTVVEFYDFFIYGIAATLVFGEVFFPEAGSQLIGIIAAMGTYAVGFVARPIGGIVFGHFGDTMGRKKLLQVCLLMIGISTVAIGLLPTYNQVGALAPVLLVTLRFIQGLALGGEWGGAVLLVSEHGGSARRGLWASFPQAAVPAGNILATGVIGILAFLMSEASFQSWGWRIAFLLSGVLVFLGYYIRSQIEDAPVFKEALAQAEAAPSEHAPLKEVLRHNKRELLTAMGMRLGENTTYYVVVSFSITYLKVIVGADTVAILQLMLLAHLLHLFAVPFCGHMSDRFGRKPVTAVGIGLAAVWAIAAFRVFDSNETAAILGILMLGLVAQACMYGPQAAFFSEMFPTRVRYTGISVSAQVTSIFAGALAPIIGTSLLARYDSSTPITVYLLIVFVISTIALIAAKETRGIEYDDLDAAAAMNQNRTTRPVVLAD
ncbi:MFS transporter [Nocardioides sp. AX2bis]|uniref:MFS transporter n=1 Tax=Nocardioides sp. AX2bis TaxID=2653157 RepID=UPI0012F10279|nr:MFS transporter [Nocardioides sp. AX2bis]VXC25890.1 Fosfomycin resistance protein AbaF [Nocardioides sp. AX2bis]